MKLNWGTSKLNPNIPLLLSWRTSGTDATDINRIGIYSIRNLANGKGMVGKASNLQLRYNMLLYLLQHDKFRILNERMQQEYNYYGPDQFEFRVHEFCPNLVLAQERYEHWRKFLIRSLGSEIKVYQIQPFKLSDLKQVLREGE
jgi:hypothetical protein